MPPRESGATRAAHPKWGYLEGADSRTPSKFRRFPCAGAGRTLDYKVEAHLRSRDRPHRRPVPNVRIGSWGRRRVRMGILGAIGETTRSYPGVMPFMTLGLVAGTLWAYRRRRFWTMAGLLLLSCGTVLVHSSGLRAEASARLGAPGQAS